MREIIFLLITILLVASGEYLMTSSTIRETSNGPVDGIERISSMRQKYYAFLGVPFAEPPITGADPYTGRPVDRRFKV